MGRECTPQVAANDMASINNACLEQLMRTFSYKIASRIVDARRDGPFRSEEDLRRRVSYLGETKVKQLKECGIGFPAGPSAHVASTCGSFSEPILVDCSKTALDAVAYALDQVTTVVECGEAGCGHPCLDNFTDMKAF